MQISHGSKAAQLTAVLDADGGGRQQTSVLEKTPVLPSRRRNCDIHLMAAVAPQMLQLGERARTNITRE